MKKIIFLFLLLAFGCRLISAQSNGHKYLKGDILILVPHGESVAEFNVAVETGNTSCGLDNGFIKVYIEGGQPPYLLKIDNVPVGSPWELKNLSPGFRRIDVSDQAGNQYALYKAQIDPSSAPVATLTATKENCGKKDASITVTVTGGKTQGMFFDWVGPNGFKSKSQNISGLSAGTYTVTVTDGDFCTDVKSVNIVSEGKPVVEYVTIKTQDSTKLGILNDTLSKDYFGCGSFKIARYFFCKPIMIQKDSLTCNDSLFGRTFSAPVDSNCNIVIYVFKSNIDTIKQFERACVSTPVKFDRVACNKVIKTSYQVVFGPVYRDTVILSCTNTLPDTIRHHFTGLTCTKDSLIEYVKYLPVKVDTITISLQTCNKDSARSLFKESVQKNSDSCVVKVLMKEVLYYGLNLSTQTIFKDTCDASGKQTQRTYIIKSFYGCDSVKVDEITRVHKPVLLKLPPLRVEFPAEARVDTVFTGQTFWGCDSILIQPYVYTPVKYISLSDSGVCGNKTSTNILETRIKFSGYRFDSLVITQKVITYESSVLHLDDYKHPTSKWNGFIDLSVSGGKGPWRLEDGKGNTINFERNNLKGGWYQSILIDGNGCMDTLTVGLSDFLCYADGVGRLHVNGGLADDDLINNYYGGEEGILRIIDPKGNVLFEEQIKMRDELDKTFTITTPGMVCAVVSFPNRPKLYLYSKAVIK